MKKLTYSFLLFAFITTFAISCEEITTDLSNYDLSELDLKEVAQLIDKEVGEAKAQNISSCSTIPIGVKPCGGPWGHIVFSDEESNRDTLIKLVERYNELDQIRNEESNRGSTCDFATAPNLTIKDGSCYGEGRYAWNPDRFPMN